MKRILKIVAPILIVGLIYLAINKPNEGSKEPEKSITLNFKVKDEDTYENLKTVDFDVKEEETLGDVFDAINGKDIEIKLEGEKDSEWGRYISAVNDYESNGQTAPFWFINSSTNSKCIELGFCDGLDTQTLEADDVFDIVFE